MLGLFIRLFAAFTESQIIFALKQAETGTSVSEICRQMGITQGTFYNWKRRYSGLGISALRMFKQLEEENSKLKKLVADLSLNKHMLQVILKSSKDDSKETLNSTMQAKRQLVHRVV